MKVQSKSIAPIKMSKFQEQEKMKRILLMVFRNILLVPYMWIKLCHRAAHPENYTLEEHVKFLKWIVFRANKGGNVK